LNNKNKEKLNKSVCNPNLSSNMFLTAFQKSNRIDLKELENSKNVLLTKKNLSKEEFKDKERIKRSLRQLPMRTRIRVSSK